MVYKCFDKGKQVNKALNNGIQNTGENIKDKNNSYING